MISNVSTVRHEISLFDLLGKLEFQMISMYFKDTWNQLISSGPLFAGRARHFPGGGLIYFDFSKCACIRIICFRLNRYASMRSFAIFEVLTFFGQSLPADQLLQLRELAPVGARAAGCRGRVGLHGSPRARSGGDRIAGSVHLQRLCRWSVQPKKPICICCMNFTDKQQDVDTWRACP